MTETTAPPAGRRPRRFWKIAALAAVVVVAALAVVAFLLARGSVGPIEEASGSSGPRPGAGTDYVDVMSLSPDETHVYAVNANRPGSFGVAFEILNSGRVAVTLEDVPPDPTYVFQESTEISSVPLPGNDFRAGEDIALDGVVMEPGERRRLVATFTWKDLCLPEDQSDEEITSITSTSSVTLRYDAMGGLFRREQEIEPPAGVALLCGALPRPDGNFVLPGSDASNP
jgi:hypothetical protein